MSDNSNIQNSLFEAMKIFSESATANSKATITIDGTITSINDEAAGVYSVEYLGSTFEVHSNSNATYSVGDNVYVLVPDGDFTKEKIILGLISASASAYTNNIENGKNYYEISNNLIDNDLGVIELSSYATINPGDIKKDITKHDASVFGALINGYLNDYRTFKLSLSAKTTLTIDQQNKGNYGIYLRIPIRENAETGQGAQTETWKTVYLETANFVGTPYRYLAWTPQDVYFTIDKQYEYDDTRLPYYSYFCYDFAQDANKTDTYDIQLKDISLKVVNEMTERETTGYSLFLKASQGEYYSTFYNNTKTITPTLKVNGKTTSLKKSAVYWFIEDTEIKADSEYYLTYGGYGWKCLNTKTNVALNEDGTKTFDYITTIQTQKVDRKDVHAATRFKCVVIYNNTVLSSIITLKNLSVKENIFLTSSKNLTTIDGITTIAANSDNTYMKDTGYVNLSALVYYDGVTNIDSNRTKVLYSWARYDKDGNYINDESELFTCVANNRITTIDGKSYFVTQVRFPVNKVEELNTVYCTAKYIYTDEFLNRYEEQIGTAKIGIATSTEYDLNLIINGDNVIYKYDSNGNSPMGSDYNGPSTSKVTTVTPLTYTITRSDGSELTDDEYQFVKYNWKMPKSTISLFSLGAGMTPTSKDDNYYYFEGYGKNFNLNYKIEDRFNISKIKQAINLTITFQGTTFTKSASISFLKEGMSGSNGTAYTALLVSGGSSAEDDASVPYGTLNANGVAQKLKFLYNTKSGILYQHDYNSNKLIEWDSKQKRIFPRVYRDGVLLDYETHYTIEYSMFDEGTTGSCFNVNKKDDGSCLLSLASSEKAPSSDSCNIVQAKIIVNVGNKSAANAQQIIYAYYPIEITIINFELPSPEEDGSGTETPLIPSLDGGFAEVMYASDGTNPSYDETNNFIVNDDKIIQEKKYVDLDYFNITWEAKNHLSIYGATSEETATGKKQTEVKIKPDNKYDDGDSKNYVRVTLAFDGNTVSKLEEEEKRCINCRDIAEVSQIQEAANLTFLKNCVKIYNEKVESWYLTIEDIKGLFAEETKAYSALEGISDTVKETIDYIELQEKYNNSKIVIERVVGTLNTLKEQTKQALIKLNALDGGEGSSAKDLISLDDYKIELTDSEIDTIKKSAGQEITKVLLIDIGRVNEKIDAYQLNYITLQSDSCKSQLGIYRQIKEDIQLIANQILSESASLSKIEVNEVPLIQILIGQIPKNSTLVKEAQQSEVKDENGNKYESKILISAFERYINFKNLILSVLSAFNQGVSYDYNRRRLQELENLFYSIAVVNSDHTLEIREYVINEYNAAIEECQSIIDTNNNRITYLNNILSTKDYTIVHIRPIVLYFNRYEMSNINAWDGNKIETGEDNTYLLAPQVGAGIKEDNNSFTGLVMGIKNTATGGEAGESSQVGLFGYSKGRQSIKLDAKSGAAIFGISGIGVDTKGNDDGGRGQIVIDPSSNAGSGLIYSSNYWTDYNKTTGMPSSYVDANKAGKGLCLNFSEGNIHIGDESGKIYSGKHPKLNSTEKGFYLSQDGLSIGSKVKIANTGVMYLGTGAVAGTGKHWTIDGGDNSYIAYGTTTFKGNGVYLGTNGISLGNAFSVSDTGVLKSTSGTIGGWTINSETLTSRDGKTTLSSDGTITCDTLYASTSGLVGGWTIGLNTLACASENNNITLDAKNGTISGGTGWSINGDGSATLTNVKITNDSSGSLLDWGPNFSVTTGGVLSAQKANIAGTITALKGVFGSASGKQITIGEDGSANVPSACIEKLEVSKIEDSAGTKTPHTITWQKVNSFEDVECRASLTVHKGSFLVPKKIVGGLVTDWTTIDTICSDWNKKYSGNAMYVKIKYTPITTLTAKGDATSKTAYSND